MPCKILSGYDLPGAFNEIFIWSCNNLLKLIQEQDEYFMNTWPQVFEHFFLCICRNTGTNHRLINFIRSKGAHYIHYLQPKGKRSNSQNNAG